MKKITAISSITAMALVLSLTTINTNQIKRSERKDVLKLSRMSVGFNKAVASVGVDHQDVYDQAKNEVNMEVAEVVKGLNLLLSSAKITKCSEIPAVSATAFLTSNEGDLYSSAVGSKAFPISTVAGVTFTKKVELKKPGTSTTVGVVYADCNTGAMEVRYNGKNDGDDTNLVIAYHESDAGLESILMLSDYNAVAGSYPAAKMAVHYVEGASTQAVTYAYAENSTDGLSGTMSANASGQVTAFTDGNVNATTAASDLSAITGLTISTYSVSTINGYVFSL